MFLPFPPRLKGGAQPYHSRTGFSFDGGGVTTDQVTNKLTSNRVTNQLTNDSLTNNGLTDNRDTNQLTSNRVTHGLTTHSLTNNGLTDNRDTNQLTNDGSPITASSPTTERQFNQLTSNRVTHGLTTHSLTNNGLTNNRDTHHIHADTNPHNVGSNSLAYTDSSTTALSTATTKSTTQSTPISPPPPRLPRLHTSPPRLFSPSPIKGNQNFGGHNASITDCGGTIARAFDESTATYWDPTTQSCTDTYNNSWWVRFTTDRIQTVLGVGIIPFGDITHDVLRYELYSCEEHNATIRNSCKQRLAICNCTL
ncbi:hypothetical protein CYMTET_54204, partial [Cymbomonas tetramitiformis]